MSEACCPNCRSALQPIDVEGLYGRALSIDACTQCQGFWFDEGESLKLSPDGTLALFRIVHERHGDRQHSLGDRLECPRCALRLSLVTDQQRDTKFQYYRCARGHGRFITFFHFLRSRNFVRSLSPREIADLRRQVRQISCSNCGAPVNIETESACGYCRAPVSMIDPDQVQKALEGLRDAAQRTATVDPALPLALARERLKVERVFAEAAAADRRSGAPFGAEGLVEAGLGIVLRWMAGQR